MAERDGEAESKEIEKNLIEQSGLWDWHMLHVSAMPWLAGWLLSTQSLPEVMLNRERKRNIYIKKNITTMGWVALCMDN